MASDKLATLYSLFTAECVLGHTFDKSFMKPAFEPHVIVVICMNPGI